MLETMQEKRMSTLEPDIDHILVTSDQLREEIGRIGERISADYAGKELLLVGVLKGAIMFMVDLARAIDLPVTIDFMLHLGIHQRFHSEPSTSRWCSYSLNSRIPTPDFTRPYKVSN